MYRVSVIMPVYNNEKTLKRAIDSILKQSIYDLELIIVNDGSTDASAQICDEYAKKEPLLVEVVHQERRGLGAARNKGLAKAQGSYVYFASPEDIFDYNMFEANLSLGEEKQADLVVFGFKDQNILSTNSSFYHLPRMPHLSRQEYFRDHYRNYHHFYPYTLHNKLYRREHLIKNRINFYQTLLNETAFFNLNVYKDLHTVAFNRSSYLIHESKEKNLHYQEKTFEGNIKVAKFLEAMFDYWNYAEEFRDIIANEYFQAIYLEIENLCVDATPFTAEEKEHRVTEILSHEMIQHYLGDLKLSNYKNPYLKGLAATFQNGNSKAALQLVNRRMDTNKLRSKFSNWIGYLFNH